MKNKKAIIAWCLYDWALSSYPVVIITFVFASYFTSKIATNSILGTEQWANAIAIAGILIAVISPILGSVTDYSGKRKYWLGLCTLFVVVSAALLWFAYPVVSSTYFVLTCLVVGTVGYYVTYVFYNAMLVDLVTPDRLGRISGWGWGMGYFGGLSILLIAFYFFIDFQPNWLNIKDYEQVRICGPLVSLWILLFSWPIFRFVPNNIPAAKAKLTFQSGLKNFFSSVKTVTTNKNLLIFLIAQMIYIDGINTVLAFGGIYGVGTFSMTIHDVLFLGIVLNTCAGLGSTALSWVHDVIGSKRTILLCLIALIGFGFAVVGAANRTQFWIFASLMSLFVGAVQSSSRSLMVELVPKEKAASMFGFYVLSGKMTTFVGPLLLGYLTLHYNSQRVGLAGVMVFFVVGTLVLLPVKTSIATSR